MVADDLTEDKVRAYRLVDNKTSEYALWDVDLLMKELGAIEFDFGNLGNWTFDIPTLEDIEVPTLEDLEIPAISNLTKELNYHEKFGVVVDCKDETEQRAVFELVDSAGYSARIVSI